MSPLKEYVYSIFILIIKYYAIKTKSNQYSQDYMEWMKLPQDTIIQRLDQCVNSIKEGNRVSLLKYIRTVVCDLIPLVNQETMLTAEEQEAIKKTLFNLHQVCHKLLQYKPSQKLTASYKGENFIVYGSKDGTFGSSDINDVLSSSFFNQHSKLPSNLNGDIESQRKDLEQRIQNLIDNHQAPLLAAHLTKQLEAAQLENSKLKADLDSQCKDLRKLQEENANLTAENSKLNADNSKLTEQVRTASSNLRYGIGIGGSPLQKRVLGNPGFFGSGYPMRGSTSTDDLTAAHQEKPQ